MSKRPHMYTAAMVRALVQPSEEQAAIALLSRAFHTDPLSTSLNPDPALRTANWFRLLTHTLASQPPSGFVHTITAMRPDGTPSSDLAAVAIWTPKTADYVESHDEDPTMTPSAISFFESIDAGAPPKPHMYLAFLGSADAGNGAASALLTRGIEVSREMGFETVALWTGNERNVGFYERFGFLFMHKVVVDGLEGWWMKKDLTAEHKQ